MLPGVSTCDFFSLQVKMGFKILTQNSSQVTTNTVNKPQTRIGGDRNARQSHGPVLCPQHTRGSRHSLLSILKSPPGWKLISRDSYKRGVRNGTIKSDPSLPLTSGVISESSSPSDPSVPQGPRLCHTGQHVTADEELSRLVVNAHRGSLNPFSTSTLK